MNLNKVSKQSTIFAKRGRNVSSLFFSKIEKYHSNEVANSWTKTTTIDQSAYLI